MALNKASLAILALRLAGKLSFDMAQRIGRVLGTVGGWLPTRSKKVTTANIRLCFPEMPEDQRRRLVRSSLRHTGQTFMEIPLMWEWPVEKCLGLIREVEGLEMVDRALAEGRGVVLLAPHLGNWELAGIYFSSRYQMAALYSPPHMAEFEDYMIRVRERAGSTLVRGDRRGLVRMVSILKGGGIAGILPDQSPDKNSGYAYGPFFGHNVRTMTLASKLIARSGAASFTTFAERLKDGRGFRMVIRPTEPGIDSADPVEAVTALNLSVEKCVREIPEQYQWEYKRFRHLTPGEINPYNPKKRCK
ncbi:MULTISPECIES: lysophospholipid acyltransferase family protein [Marinobacter]|uniref:KDO2-lipid IV(A) lauroyltransferase n=1 Tax=Marinobacter segnicrescens TaxID=430453 RepID=A0A1I0DX61_9GAMM|nr:MULTISPECIES: lysophospholipid acyltransferase family protein [Marinobacter]UZD66659.1 lysophospholipid acyltransferase family protein [Marinobacter sp. AN1]SET36984.1 KDO2-lipid IV(A) lauroyltransferase [Marinobacter segnicrescens]